MHILENLCLLCLLLVPWVPKWKHKTHWLSPILSSGFPKWTDDDDTYWESSSTRNAVAPLRKRERSHVKRQNKRPGDMLEYLQLSEVCGEGGRGPLTCHPSLQYTSLYYSETKLGRLMWGWTNKSAGSVSEYQWLEHKLRHLVIQCRLLCEG